jgi:hypothetical protein
MTPPAFPAPGSETRDPPSDQVPAGADACGADVADGGACNEIRDVGSAITPTCTTGEVPVGTGGTIAGGTYTLVAETYYNAAHCPGGNLSATLVIEGGCYRMVEHSSPGDERSAEVRVSFKAQAQGDLLISQVTCSPIAGRPALAKTFTAEQSTLMFFTANAAAGSSNPDRVEMFVRQGEPGRRQ